MSSLGSLARALLPGAALACQLSTYGVSDGKATGSDGDSSTASGSTSDVDPTPTGTGLVATGSGTSTGPGTSGANAGEKWCADSEGDGAGDPKHCTEVPPGDTPPDGWVDNDDDCDDSDPDTFPGAAPNDDKDACMTDADGDDWGDDMPTSPDAVPGTDCDDGDPKTFPGAATKDSVDQCMHDGDGDGHGDARPDPEQPGIIAGSDCYDDNPMLSPSNSVLLTAEITTGSFLELDPSTGELTEYASVDVMAFNPWIPTSIAMNPLDGSIVAALAFNSTLVSLNYCGAGAPTLLSAPHKKNLCGIGFDRAGTLHGIDGQVDQFLTFKADGSLASVHPLTFEGKTLNVADCGMAFDCHQDRLLISDSGSGGIYVVNPADGTTTRIVDLPNEVFGSGLEYDPVTRQALSCDQASFLSLALDGSNNFTKLPDLSAPADDLGFGPKCN